MKKYILKIGLLLFVCMLAVIFASCDNQMSSNLIDSQFYGNTEPSDLNDFNDAAVPAYVRYDSTKGIAIYVDEYGVETPVQSDERSGTVVCSEVIDFIPFESSNLTSRSAGSGRETVKAFVLGKSGDGCSGLWMVYSSGRVSPVINSAGLDTSELLEMVEGREPMSGRYNWSYEAVDMVSNADGSEIIIIGYAENSGVDRHNYHVEAGTTVAVYWTVTLDEDDYYHISRAKVIGYKDPIESEGYSRANRNYSSYRNDRNHRKAEYRYHKRWMMTLRMFFTGWFDNYLVMASSIESGENDGEYKIYGTDQDDEDAFAVVTAKKILSIEKYEDPGSGDNQAPYDIIGPTEITLEGGTERVQFFSLKTKAPGIYLDPDEGDSVTFLSSTLPSYVTLDPVTGIITVIDATYDIYDLEITVWTEDDKGFSSNEFTLIIHFYVS